MRLLLSMLNYPDGMKSESRDTDTELVIGRGAEAGRVLADPTRRIGRTHCRLTPFGDIWQVTDMSLNGTFLNDSPTPIGRERSQDLHDGDRLRIGDYVIEARYEAPASLHMPLHDPALFQPVRNDPFGGGGGGGHWPQGAWDSPVQGHDPFSPIGPAPKDEFVGAPFADRAPPGSDIWHPPGAGRVVLPEDWDLEPVAPPVAPAERPSPAAAAVIPEDFGAELDPTPAQPAVAAVQPVVAEPAAAALAPSRDETGLLAAFLRGAELKSVGDAEPAATMEGIGKLLRVTVDRLRALQIDRSDIKREFRILATRHRPEDNNPIKFSANTDAALHALFASRRAPDVLVAEVLDDVRTHEIAMIKAMQEAVHALLDTLSPDRVRTAADEHGRGVAIPLQRKARAFEQYEAMHAKTVRDMTDDFDSVFGKAFAQAYERIALDEEDTPGGRRR